MAEQDQQNGAFDGLRVLADETRWRLLQALRYSDTLAR
jgi:hypothetical protein